MFTITRTVRRQGIPPKKFLKDQRERIERMKPELERLAYDASKQFRDVINARRHRKGTYNKDSLANAFKTYNVEYTPTRVIFGVGDIEYLDSEYPYWNAADKGGIIPPPTRGWFGRHQKPKNEFTGTGKEVFHEDSRGYPMVPKTPTRPLNYIKITTDWMNKRWNKVWGRKAFK